MTNYKVLLIAVIIIVLNYGLPCGKTVYYHLNKSNDKCRHHKMTKKIETLMQKKRKTAVA